MYVQVRYNGESHIINVLSRLSTVRELKKLINKEIEVLPKEQVLLFNGKLLEDKFSLFDYKIMVNSRIEMIKRAIVQDATNENQENTADNGQSKTEASDPKPSTSSQNDDVKIEDIYKGDVNELLGPAPPCEKCKDKKELCGECGCVVCKRKDNADVLLMCDECEYYYHTFCLEPALVEVPDDDWYCPVCKNEDDIVRPGAGVPLRKRKSYGKKSGKATKASKTKAGETTRDWGRGYATTGRTKECTKVPKNHFGPIPGIEVGMNWRYRNQVGEEGVHRFPVGGMAGKAKEGCYSLVLAGGYVDDIDYGEEFLYTGSGGRDLSGNRRTAAQSFDQQLTRYNQALAISCDAKFNNVNGADAGDRWKNGKPIRVLRSAKMKHSQYRPLEGYRYDGIYKLVKYWPHRGKNGFIVWRFLLRRDDDSPAPWTDEGKKICEENGYHCVYPEGHLEAKEKAEREKKEKKEREKKEGKKGEKSTSDSGNKEPAPKRARKVFNINASTRELIKADAVNESTWKEILETTFTSKLEFTGKLEVDFTCPICQFIVFDPITTLCKHNMCGKCFTTLMGQSSKTCPNCRSDLNEGDNLPNESLGKILKSVFGNSYNQ